MVLKYEVESCDAAKLNDSDIRRTVVLDKWIEIEGYFMQYPKKVGIVYNIFSTAPLEQSFLKIAFLSDEHVEGNIPRPIQ